MIPGALPMAAVGNIDGQIDVVKIGDQYIADPSRNSSRGTFNTLSLHFVLVSNIAALITALTAFKVGRNNFIRAPGAFRNLSI